MSGRTGLGLLEVAILEAVESAGGGAGQPYRRTSDVLVLLEDVHGVGPRHAYPLVVDLAVPWLRHLPLLDGYGNLGSRHGDQSAEAKYTEIRLSPTGALALAAERGEVGPLPLDLIEGTMWRGGRVPAFDPRRVLDALAAGAAEAGPPTTASGGRVGGEIDVLLAGGEARLRFVCTIIEEPGILVITEVPLCAPTDQVVQFVAARASRHERLPLGHLDRGDLPALPSAPVIHISDDSTGAGIRIVCRLAPDADAVEARRWLTAIWPVTVEADCRLPAPMPDRLRTWHGGDGSGVAALAAMSSGR